MTPAGDTQATWRLGRRPALDGVRGLAVLLVIAGHLLPSHAASPAVGVNLFFVLSGFLITSILWEEWQRTGRLDIGGFYRRRVRRLMPALAVVLVATAASMALIGQARDGALFGVAAASYVGNLVMASGQWLGPLSHTWSLAIEEQFYILWPLLLLPAMRRLQPRQLIALLAAGVIVVQVMRAYLWASGAAFERLAFGTDLQADGLLLGCALAIVFHTRAVAVPALAAPLSVALLVTMTFVMPAGLHLPLGSMVAVLASGLLVAALASQSGGRDRLLNNTWLRRTGLISYGLYLWHYPVLWHFGFFDERPHPGIAAAGLAMGITVAAALASYLLVERRFLRHRPAPAEHEPLPPTTVPALSGGLSGAAR